MSGLSARVEKFEYNHLELSRLFPGHYERMAVPMLEKLGRSPASMPLAPRWADYAKLERVGALFMVALRDGARLVGYWVMMCEPGLHYAKTLSAKMDMWELAPGYRGGAAPLILARAVEMELYSREIKIAYFGEKLHAPAGRLYSALGFTPIEQYWAKWIGE